MNIIRSILREFGHIFPTGIEAVSKFAREHGTEGQLEMPEIADGILGVMCHQLNGLNARIDGLMKLLDQKPFRLATVAMANKSARIIWAILTKGEEYRQPIV